MKRLKKFRLSDRNQGILYIIMAGFFFAIMSFFIRVSGDLPTMQKAFFRNLVAAVISITMLLRSQEGLKIKKSSYGDLFWRCACGTAGLICNFYALDHMNISDANILNKLSPFFAVIFSIFILKEKASKMQWAVITIAFIGALFIVKPSFNSEVIYGVAGMLGGLGAGVAYTFVRKLGGKGERGAVIVMCFSVFSCMVTLPSLVFNYAPMRIEQVVALLLAGLAASGGQLTVTKAYTKAPAKEISVYDYIQVIFAAMLGFIFLEQIPDMLSVVGYVIIMGVAIFQWKYTHRKSA